MQNALTYRKHPYDLALIQGQCLFPPQNFEPCHHVFLIK
jgi:hypothetical protein